MRKVPDRDHKIIEYFIEAGKEKTAAEHIALNIDSADHKQLRLLEEYCDRFTDSEILFNTIITVYKNDSEIFPKSLILLAKRLSKEIPEEKRLQGLPEEKWITVYRGIDPSEAQAIRTLTAWSPSLSCAIWQANGIEAGEVWQAEIERKKIIAFVYVMERADSEILQHLSIKNPQKVEISREEWDQDIRQRKIMIHAINSPHKGIIRDDEPDIY